PPDDLRFQGHQPGGQPRLRRPGGEPQPQQRRQDLQDAPRTAPDEKDAGDRHDPQGESAAHHHPADDPPGHRPGHAARHHPAAFDPAGHHTRYAARHHPAADDDSAAFDAAADDDPAADDHSATDDQPGAALHAGP